MKQFKKEIKELQTNYERKREERERGKREKEGRERKGAGRERGQGEKEGRERFKWVGIWGKKDEINYRNI